MRKTIGSVVKSKTNPKETMIKISQDVSLKKGQYVNLENESGELAGIQKALAAGAIDEAYAAELSTKATARWNKEVGDKKVKDFVLFNLVVNEKA